jgi:rhodanese-related sulfurtransferase
LKEETMPKSYKEMVAEANASVRSLGPEEAKALVGQPNVLFVDVREPEELRKTGKIPGAVHAVRGLLEYYADPESPAHKRQLDPAKRIIINCASGGRSALAAKTLKEMGYKDVWNLTGGMNAWQQANGPTEPVED